MLVRFADLCDVTFVLAPFMIVKTCAKRSDEYTMWPTCTECMDSICPEHMAPGTFDDNDGRLTCVCVRCA